MEKYIEPEMELVTFDSEDVLTTSGGGSTCANPSIPLFGGPSVDKTTTDVW